MRKRLWLLDLTLLALVIWTGAMIRDRYYRLQSREQGLLRQMVPVPPPAVLPALSTIGPVTAASYLNVAQQFLFSRDRNPTVILDPPPPPPPPPPPKPMPALPLSYGVMNLGAGPTIILVDRAGGQHRGYRQGETIGEFKIVALTNQDITLEWDGKKINKKIEELVDKKAKEAPAPPPAAAQGAAPTAQPAAPPVKPVEAGPGVELGESSRACVPGDTTAPGTVKDGFRKVVTKTPFGDSCRWEAVK